MFSGIEFTVANEQAVDHSLPDYQLIHDNLKRSHDEMSDAHTIASNKQPQPIKYQQSFACPVQPLIEQPSLAARQVAIANQYLASSFNDQSVRISHPKYALKSYLLKGKKENRRISPPPSVTLIGSAWNLSEDSPSPVNVRVDTNLLVANQLCEWPESKRVKFVDGLESSRVRRLPVDPFNVALRDYSSFGSVAASQSCQLIHQSHFTDLGCHDGAPLYVNIEDTNARTTVFSLASPKIEALGKVSTARSVSAEKAIRSGSTVSLVHRTGSQHTSTRFLRASDDGQSLATSPIDWDEFVIWKANDPNFDRNFRHNQSPIPVAAASAAMLSDEADYSYLNSWGRSEMRALALHEKMFDPVVWMVPESSVSCKVESMTTSPSHPNVGLRTECNIASSIESSKQSSQKPVHETSPISFSPHQPESVIRYGDAVYLQSVRTGTISRLMLLSHANNSITSAKQPVHNLSKIALEFADWPGMYLYRKASVEQVVSSGEPCFWQIIPTVSTDFTYFIPKDNPIADDSALPLPVPTVRSVHASLDYITLTGCGFSGNSMIMFGHYPSPCVEFVDIETLRVYLPKLTGFVGNIEAARHDAFHVGVPLLVVRADGLLFRSGHYYRYSSPDCV